MNYIPPFTITPKILNLVSRISESVGKLEVLAPTAMTPTLRKANKIKTITGTLAIEGNTVNGGIKFSSFFVKKLRKVTLSTTS